MGRMAAPPKLPTAMAGAGMVAMTWGMSPRSLFTTPSHLRGNHDIAVRGSPQHHQQQAPPDAAGNGQSRALRVSCAVAGIMAAVGASARRRSRAPQTLMRADSNWERSSFLDVLSDTDKFIEDDRRTSRPVFGYPEWKRQRSSDRLFRNVASIPVSSTIRANWQEVLACTVSAALVVLWNENNPEIVKLAPESAQSLLTFQMVLPGLPFTLSSAALSLLLVFRTNQAYNRWWEARCIWGAIINTCRDIVRQALVRFDPKDEALKAEVTRLVSAFPRSLIFHVGERTDLSVEILDKKYGKILTDEEKERLMSCTHKPMTVTGMLADAIRKAKLSTIDEMKLDQDVSKFSDYYGMCERIFKTPIPLSYTRLTSRFLGVWMLFLPMALYSAVTPHWAIVPIVSIFAYLIFSIEEVGIQLEEPFSRLPMGAMADGIDASIFEALELDKKAPKVAVQKKAARSQHVSPDPNKANLVEAMADSERQYRRVEQELQAVTLELEKQKAMSGNLAATEKQANAKIDEQAKQLAAAEEKLKAEVARLQSDSEQQLTKLQKELATVTRELEEAQKATPASSESAPMKTDAQEKEFIEAEKRLKAQLAQLQSESDKKEKELQGKLQAVIQELEGAKAKSAPVAEAEEPAEEPTDKSDLRQRVFLQQKQLISNERRLEALTAAEERTAAIAEERKQTLEKALAVTQDIARIVGARVKKGIIIRRDMQLLELLEGVKATESQMLWKQT